MRDPMIEPLTTLRNDWLHGLVRCPKCGNHLDARDVVEQLHEDRAPLPTAVLVEHRRCGAVFRVNFAAAGAPS